MEVSRDVPDALSADLVCYWSVSGVRVIVVDCWKVHNSLELKKAWSSSTVIGDPLLVSLFSHDLFGVTIALVNDLFLR